MKRDNLISTAKKGEKLTLALTAAETTRFLELARQCGASTPGELLGNLLGTAGFMAQAVADGGKVSVEACDNRYVYTKKNRPFTLSAPIATL